MFQKYRAKSICKRIYCTFKAINWLAEWLSQCFLRVLSKNSQSQVYTYHCHCEKISKLHIVGEIIIQIWMRLSDSQPLSYSLCSNVSLKNSLRLYLFWLKDHESDLAILRTCMTCFFVSDIDWAVIAAMKSNIILWIAGVLLIVKPSNLISLL